MVPEDDVNILTQWFLPLSKLLANFSSFTNNVYNMRLSAGGSTRCGMGMAQKSFSALKGKSVFNHRWQIRMRRDDETQLVMNYCINLLCSIARDFRTCLVDVLHRNFGQERIQRCLEELDRKPRHLKCQITAMEQTELITYSLYMNIHLLRKYKSMFLILDS